MLKFFISIVGACSFVIALICVSILLVSSDVFFSWQYSKAVGDRGVLNLALKTKDIVVNGTNDEEIKNALSDVMLPTSSLKYDQAEIGHLIDVSDLLRRSKHLLLWSVVVLIVASIFDYKRLLSYFMKLALVILSLVGAVALCLTFFWWEAFTIFHQIFFPQGNWSFPANSLLITVFPEALWMRLFWSVSLSIFAFLLISLICIRKILKV